MQISSMLHFQLSTNESLGFRPEPGLALHLDLRLTLHLCLNLHLGDAVADGDPCI